jgi:hypothetical protein
MRFQNPSPRRDKQWFDKREFCGSRLASAMEFRMENTLRSTRNIGPYQMFSPIHLAWLDRHDAKRLDITAADLDSIEHHQPDAVIDPLFAKCRALANAGKLRRRPGRKPGTTVDYLTLWYARFEILDEMTAIYERRRSGKARRCRSDREPCYQAAETVARRMRLPYGGPWLVKKISKAGIR